MVHIVKEFASDYWASWCGEKISLNSAPIGEEDNLPVGKEFHTTAPFMAKRKDVCPQCKEAVARANAPAYEAPTLEALGDLKDLVGDRAEALSIFKAVLRHADHIMQGVLPGIVLGNEVNRMRAFVRKHEETKPGAPKPKAGPPDFRDGAGGVSAHGNQIPAGIETCKHGVHKGVTCQACLAEAQPEGGK